MVHFQRFRHFAAMALVTLLTPVAVPATHDIDQSRDRQPERQSREIELAVSTLGLKPGDTVAEIGAGDARFSFRFAEVVGPLGRVYANELGATNASRIGQRAERRELTNVVVVEGAVDDTNLPDSCCDAIDVQSVTNGSRGAAACSSHGPIRLMRARSVASDLIK